jgi:broad specificity phosphatase PhoE
MPSAAIIFSALNPLFVNAKEYFVALIYLCIVVTPIVLFMRPRRFYFVRHGETILNAAHIRQGKDGSLSENGKLQTQHVGLYLLHFHIKRIISSPFERARETAAIINGYLKVPISYSPLFAERRNPAEIIGKHDDDSEVARIVDQMDRAYHDDNYRFSDEENFKDLKNRARQALGFLSRRTSRETCVVTHSIFLKMLIAYLLYRDDIHATDYAKLSFFNASDNANITICEFHPWKVFSKTRGWEVVSYNETPEK